MATRPSSPPDLNAETYPFAVVERLVDRYAGFSLYSQPAADGPLF